MILLIFLMGMAHASSGNILILSSELNATEARALLSSAPEKVYSDLQIDKHLQKAQNKNLFQLALKLREYELRKDYELIHSLCSEVSSQRHSETWGTEDRKLISRCLNWLAKLSPDPRRKASLMIESHAYSKSVKHKKMQRVSNWIQKNYDWLLINGEAHAAGKRRVPIPRTSFLLTLISNRFRTLKKVITPEEFNNFQAAAKPLVSGNCSGGFRYEGRGLSELEIRRVRVASKNCQRALDDSDFVEESHLAKKFPTKNRIKGARIPSWAWWLAGGLVGYQILKSQQSDRPHSPPSTSKRGF